jgi:hypothetical protein
VPHRAHPALHPAPAPSRVWASGVPLPRRPRCGPATRARAGSRRRRVRRCATRGLRSRGGGRSRHAPRRGRPWPAVMGRDLREPRRLAPRQRSNRRGIGRGPRGCRGGRGGRCSRRGGRPPDAR